MRMGSSKATGFVQMRIPSKGGRLEQGKWSICV